MRLGSVVCAALTLAAMAGASPSSAQLPLPNGRSGQGIRVLDIVQGFGMEATPELASIVNALLSDTNSHMRMAPRRAATAEDSARARHLVQSARLALAKYDNVALAEQDGYVKFLPWLEDQPIYHYNNIQNVIETFTRFDAGKPVSLLYKKDRAGKMKLAGAMYTGGSPAATLADLDARLPVGVAQWHEHVDFCGPNPDSVRAGTQKIDAASTTRWLKITTREACTAAGGRFVPRVFGWMAHVYLFAGDDWNTIWGGDEHAHMDVHPHHPPSP